MNRRISDFGTLPLTTREDIADLRSTVLDLQALPTQTVSTADQITLFNRFFQISQRPLHEGVHLLIARACSTTSMIAQGIYFECIVWLWLEAIKPTGTRLNWPAAHTAIALPQFISHTALFHEFCRQTCGSHIDYHPRVQNLTTAYESKPVWLPDVSDVTKFIGDGIPGHVPALWAGYGKNGGLPYPPVVS